MVIAFQAAFAEMPGREVQVLRYRFGLLDGFEHTIQETASVTPNAYNPLLFITRERARQIEQRALRRLRHPRRVRFLTGA